VSSSVLSLVFAEIARVGDHYAIQGHSRQGRIKVLRDSRPKIFCGAPLQIQHTVQSVNQFESVDNQNITAFFGAKSPIMNW